MPEASEQSSGRGQTHLQTSQGCWNRREAKPVACWLAGARSMCTPWTAGGEVLAAASLQAKERCWVGPFPQTLAADAHDAGWVGSVPVNSGQRIMFPYSLLRSSKFMISLSPSQL